MVSVAAQARATIDVPIPLPRNRWLNGRHSTGV